MSIAFKSKIAKAGLGLFAAAMIAGPSALAFAQTSGTCYQFTSNLALGSKGEAVRQLQVLLNSNASTKIAAAAGKAGSTGYETTTFGPATKAAVKKFQALYGISQVGNFGPATRAKANTLCGTTPAPTPTPTGPVSAMLSTDNPAATTILSGQALADLAHFTFSGTGTLTKVTLQRTGLSASADLSNVYLFDGNQRVTDGASVNTNGMIVFSGLNIPVSGMKNLSVKADMNNTTTSATLGVNLVSFMVSGSAETTVSLMGNLHAVTSGSGLTATSALTSQNVSAANIDAGLSSYTVWSSQMNVNTRAVWLKSMNFRVTGSAPVDAVQNLKLYVDGSPVGTTASVGSNGYAYVNLGAGTMLSTGSHTVDLRGDIVKGSSYSVTFAIQNAADVVLTDSQTMTNIAMTALTTYGTAGTLSINAGSVTVNIDPTFTAMTNVTGGATNTVIGKFKLRAYGEDVKVQTFKIRPAVTGATASGSTATTTLNNVTLYFNGSQIGSSQNWNAAAIAATSLTYNLGSSFIIPAGSESSLEVRADLQTSDSYNYSAGTVSVSLNATDNANNGQGMASNVATIDVPASTITTSGLTMQTGSLAVSKNTSFTSQTINPNTTGAKIGSFILQNQSTSESVRVTNLAIALALTTASSTNYSNLVTDETSGSGATPVNPSTVTAPGTSTNNFSVNFTLAPGSTKTINVFANTSAATSGIVIVSLTPTALGVSSGVNVSPAAAAGQTITIGSGTFNAPTLVTSSSTLSQYVAGGSTTGATDATKARFNLTATNGTATISEMKFTNTGTSGTVTSVKVGGVSAPMVSDIAYLTGLSLTVPNGGTGLDVDAFASYAPVGTTGVTSGSTGLLQLCSIKYTIGGTTSTSGDTTCASPLLSSGQTMKLVGSKPTVTVAQPAGVILTTGAVEVIDVTITADAAGPISITSFPITASISAGAGTPSFTSGGAFTVKDASNNTVTLAANTGAVNQFTSTTGGSATVTLGSAYTIAAGASQTFKVFVPVSALGTGTLPNTYVYTSLATGSGFAWTDVAGAGSVTTGTTYVYNYPSTFTSSIHN